MPDLTRRAALILGGSVSIAGVVATGLTGMAEPATAATSAASIPLRATFARGVGTGFLASSLQGRFRVRLVEILDLRHAPAADPHTFALNFLALGTSHLPQGIYRLTSLAVPACRLFLAPVGIQSGPQRLQAVVNRTS